MPTFRELIANAAKTVFLNPLQFGEQITYTPLTGSVKAITGVVERFSEMPEVWADGTGVEVTASVSISNDPIVGVPSPVRGDQMTFDGKNYLVKKIKYSDVDGIYELLVSEVDVDEKGGIYNQR